MLYIVEKFIFQNEYQISFEKNGIFETKSFIVKEEVEQISDNPHILINVALVLNPILLRPFEVNLQIRAFFILRRLYYLFPNKADFIIHPLVLVLSNISIYAVDSLPYFLIIPRLNWQNSKRLRFSIIKP